ncbi:thiamine pyrophosphate-dependent enzyme, partial [Aeromicrobium alkaliterrae]|uniref:thiamine pyrophosphate-dependent enzyme n=1 Tax=Aeromicrobium alkaliterrae TaxID=302168 RepID=UPI0031E3B5C2
LAFGAAAASPDTPVVLFTGDGSFGYYLSEYEAASRQGFQFVAIVGNNAAWGLEQNLQSGLYGDEYVIASTLSSVRYSDAVRALGGHGEYVDSLSELPAALERALQSGLPSCIEIPIAPVPSALTQAVIARGGEV